MLQREELVREQVAGEPEQLRMQANSQQASGVACSRCGTINEPEAAFCASCGAPLHRSSCPHCGNEIDVDADYCEVCHRYIRHDVCSFCGAAITGEEAYCPQCGSPRGGIVCPTCHTLNEFSFCKQCGTALTEEARQMMRQLRLDPEYRQMVVLAKELDQLQMEVPLTTQHDVVRDEHNMAFREHVLKLLAQDKGMPDPVIEAPKEQPMSREELDKKKRDVMDKLTELLDRMAIPQMPSPAQVLNYAMAQKPAGVRLAWMCNFKHAMHSSPCGCAKPQMGGKWVVLGHNSKQEIKDDK